MKDTRHHCSLTDTDTPGTGEHLAIWIDADGETSGEEYLVCDDCLAAGSTDGPGYRKVSAPTTTTVIA